MPDPQLPQEDGRPESWTLVGAGDYGVELLANSGPALQPGEIREVVPVSQVVALRAELDAEAAAHADTYAELTTALDDVERAEDGEWYWHERAAALRDEVERAEGERSGAFEACDELRSERDEARAEVARLKGVASHGD